MATGTCLCGTVQWRASGELTPLSHCHCSMCRKAHGSAFATFVSCPENEFAWTAGETSVRTYTAPGGLERAFCGLCGSAVPGTTPEKKRKFMPAGCLDGDPGLRGGRHIFVASKAPWHSIASDLERHDAYPAGPGMYSDQPVIERPELEPQADGVTRGSCLCGEVAFEVTEPFQAIYNCHCSRCRKARGAAHATNGFVPYDAVKFLRGETLITVYKLPEAQHFTQAFCSTCGSAVPRKDANRNFGIIPFGALDDDPKQGPQEHIYVGSMAPWYEIGDDIPQSE